MFSELVLKVAAVGVFDIFHETEWFTCTHAVLVEFNYFGVHLD